MTEPNDKDFYINLQNEFSILNIDLKCSQEKAIGEGSFSSAYMLEGEFVEKNNKGKNQGNNKKVFILKRTSKKEKNSILNEVIATANINSAYVMKIYILAYDKDFFYELIEYGGNANLYDY